MIMARNADGSYKEITTIKTKDGSNIGKIVGKDGNIYFTSTVNATAEGYPCILPKSVGNDTVDYSIYGNSVQDGTPSPDNPIEVESVGDKTKNLIPTPSTKTWTEGYIVVGTGAIHAQTTGLEWISPMIKLEPTQTKISMSINIPYEHSGNTWIVVGFYDGNGAFITRSGGETEVLNGISIPNNAAYARFNARFFDPNKLVEAEFQAEYNPTPTAYEPYGYKIPVVTRGKNLFDEETVYSKISENNLVNYYPIYVGEGTFTLSSTTPATYDNSRNLFLISGSVTSGASSNINGVSLGTSRTANSINGYVTIGVRRAYGIDPLDYKTQLELGNIETPYESYKKPVTTNIYLDEPIRKIGDYADVLNFENQTVTRNIKKLWLTSDINWSLRNINDHGITNFSISLPVNNRLILNNRFNIQGGIIADVVTEGFYVNSASNILYIRISQEKASTVEEFKQYLDENPTYIDYAVLTAETESISVSSIPTFKGTTIITTDTEVSPSDMKITYKARR